MKRGARGTEWFNRLTRSARLFGQIVLLLAVFSTAVPFAYAQDATETPEPFLRVRNEALRNSAARIKGLLDDINERHLHAAERLLGAAQNVLDRIADAAERQLRRGYDTAAAREAIANARREIDEAREAIRNQRDHEYVLDDVTDLTVRDRLRAVRDQLADDLRVVRTQVREAIAAVRDAARALRAARPAGE